GGPGGVGGGVVVTDAVGERPRGLVAGDVHVQADGVGVAGTRPDPGRPAGQVVVERVGDAAVVAGEDARVVAGLRALGPPAPAPAYRLCPPRTVWELRVRPQRMVRGGKCRGAVHLGTRCGKMRMHQELLVTPGNRGEQRQPAPAMNDEGAGAAHAAPGPSLGREDQTVTATMSPTESESPGSSANLATPESSTVDTCAAGPVPGSAGSPSAPDSSAASSLSASGPVSPSCSARTAATAS